MQKLDLPLALKTAQTAAAEGRKVLLHYFGQLKKVQEKSFAGLVSEADVESERVISAILLKAFPHIQILGEEGAFEKNDERLSPDQWVVDPLDGTTNYVHGFHVFCVSIGLQWQGRLVAGVIDVPLLDKTYSAAEGLGATVNGKNLKVSQAATVRESLLATGFFPGNDDTLREQIRIFSDLVFEARGIRRAGAAAYDLCMVAEGVFDAFWEPNLKPWDAAAGVVLIREAGGVVWNYDGVDYELGHQYLLAGNRKLAAEIAERIQKVRAAGD